MKKALLFWMMISAGILLCAGEDTGSMVKALITKTENSGAVFIRNGKRHSSEEAADHLQKKYEYFLKKGKVKTAEDFIKMAGTKSLISGKPYMLIFPDGREEESAVWLKTQLDTMCAGSADQGN